MSIKKPATRLWITKLAKVKEDKPYCRLVGFISDAKRFIPRSHYKIFIDGEEAGFVTSGNLSPTLGKPIGLGYVPWDKREAGTKIEIEARGKRFPAEIVKLPFVKLSTLYRFYLAPKLLSSFGVFYKFVIYFNLNVSIIFSAILA